jgi:hypothetical protein
MTFRASLMYLEAGIFREKNPIFLIPGPNR